jgi:signal peptidase I
MEQTEFNDDGGVPLLGDTDAAPDHDAAIDGSSSSNGSHSGPQVTGHSGTIEQEKPGPQASVPSNPYQGSAPIVRIMPVMDETATAEKPLSSPRMDPMQEYFSGTSGEEIHPLEEIADNPRARITDSVNRLDDLPTYEQSMLRSRLRIMVTLLILLVLVGFLLAIRANKIQFDQVISESMEPTLQVGDILLTDANALPQRYDLVVAWEPDSADDKIVKRIMGVPGDLVIISGGILYVNGQEEYSTAVSTNSMIGRDLKIRVPENHLFLMGDNRDESHDSRDFGTVPHTSVRGVVYRIIWPPQRLGRPDPYLDLQN